MKYLKISEAEINHIYQYLHSLNPDLILAIKNIEKMTVVVETEEDKNKRILAQIKELQKEVSNKV